MLRKSYQQGVRNVIATPHYIVYHWRTKPEQIQRLMEQMAKAVQKVMPELRLYSGQEIQYFEGMADMLQRGELLTLAGSHYVLVEFLPQSQWSQIQNAVRELLLAGYFPVLAHIERYQCLRKTGRLTELQREGAYLQMNYGSLIKLRNVWNLRERLERRWCRKVLLAVNISVFWEPICMGFITVHRTVTGHLPGSEKKAGIHWPDNCQWRIQKK